MSITLPIGSYNQPSRVPNRLVNVYPQATVSNKSPVELLSVPGVVSSATLDGPGRGMFAMRGQLYAVGGTTLYAISAGGATTALGTVPGSERLTFAGLRNASDVSEVVMSNGYRYNGATVGAITDADLPTMGVVDSIDNYIVYTKANSDVFGWSELNDSGSYIGTDYTTVDGVPDDLVTLKVDHRQILLFGQASTEIWWNSGWAGTFERLAGGFLEVGCAAKLGVTKIDNSVFWIAQDRTIRRLAGQVPQRVSQHGMEEKLAGYATVADCIAFAYPWNGHSFVVFRFPSAGACWVLDLGTQEWHERSSYGSGDWQVTDAVECYGKVWLQHAVTGDVGYLSDTCYTEWGGILRRSWTYPQVWAAGRYTFHSDLEVVCRTGDAPINTTPYLHLEISNDGGNRWLELPPREIGLVGEYDQRIRWPRLGRSRDRVYRCSVSEAVPLRVLATEITVA